MITIKNFYDLRFLILFDIPLKTSQLGPNSFHMHEEIQA